MNRDTLAGLYVLGLAFCAGFALAKALEERRFGERLREEQQERRWERVGQAIQDLHGRIDAEKWLAGGGEPESAPVDAGAPQPA